MSEAEYTRLTHDLTLAAARQLAADRPGATFCYVSGEGTDSSGTGRIMWARVKGRPENALRTPTSTAPRATLDGCAEPNCALIRDTPTTPQP